MFTKGTPKPPGSGRKKGTPNKISKDIFEVLERNQFDIFQEFVKLYEDVTTEKELKVAILREMSQYAFPKRRAMEVEISGKLSLESLVLGSLETK